MFLLDDTEGLKAKIKVVGVGGAGGNALNTMIDAGLTGVDFIAMNTDAQDLERNLAPEKIQLAPELTKGLGAGADPQKGKAAAEAERDTIRQYLEGADMVFVTAGMGGGTGTGAAPVVAEIAKEVEALVVGVVTKPFSFEGKVRARNAEQGLMELVRNVDTLLTIPNDKLFQLNKRMKMIEAFRYADQVLLNAVRGIADLITHPGYINVDFADVRRVMGSYSGAAVMGLGEASGEGRAAEAAERALRSPLLDDIDVHGARGLLVNVTATEDLETVEYQEVMEVLSNFAHEEAERICGMAVDPSMGDGLRVTVIATGLPGAMPRSRPVVRPIHGGGLKSGERHSAPGAGAGRSSRHATGGHTELMPDEQIHTADLDNVDVPTFLRRQAD